MSQMGTVRIHAGSRVWWRGAAWEVEAVSAKEVRRVLCGAGLGALRDAPVLRSWIEFTTHTTGGIADWDATLAGAGLRRLVEHRTRRA